MNAKRTVMVKAEWTNLFLVEVASSGTGQLDCEDNDEENEVCGKEAGWLVVGSATAKERHYESQRAQAH